MVKSTHPMGTPTPKTLGFVPYAYRMYTQKKIKRIRSHFLTLEMPNFINRISVLSFLGFFLVSFRFAVYSYWWWITVINEMKRNKNLFKKIILKKKFLRKLSKTNSKLATLWGGPILW